MLWWQLWLLHVELVVMGHTAAAVAASQGIDMGCM